MSFVFSIGAGNEQLDSMRTALEMGFQIVAIDKNPRAPGFSMAAHAFPVDISNEAEAVQIAKCFDVKAVLPAPIGRYLTTVGAVNDALQLRGISKEAALRCADKNLFHEFVLKQGFNRPRQQIVRFGDDLRQAIRNFGLPCILKPRRGSGSKGVVAIHDPLRIEEAVQEHVKHVNGDDTLIEEFLSGREFGIDAAVTGGVFHPVLIREKELTALPYRQAIGMFTPPRLQKNEREAILEQTRLHAEAIGIDDCLIHADVLLADDGRIYVLEIAGRPAGLHISSKIIPFARGIPFLKEGLKIALGFEPELTPRWEKPLAFRFLAGVTISDQTEKYLQWKDYIVDLRNNPSDMEERAAKITSGADVLRGGVLITTGSTVDEALEISDNIMKN